MSAIAGMFFFDDQPVDRAHLVRMAETLAPWGPDRAGFWNAGHVGMAHRMLWTTPESLSEQLPLVKEAGALVLTADARIDNRRELATTLGLDDRPAEDVSDSELILAAYERWGERCPEKLLGDFAFAIWDARKQHLFCARDPIGVKSLYYYQSDRFLVFATQIKALLCVEDVPRRLNEVKLAEYLALIEPDKATTFYCDILRLPPAHSMTVQRGRKRIQSYWSLDPSREVRLGSNEEYAEAFGALFKEAVRCRLRSAFPVGSMLSGGLDSSSIVCTARKLLESEDRLLTFSAVFPSLRTIDARVDETRYIDAVAAADGIDPHYVRADGVSPLLGFLWQEEEPIPAASMYMDWTVFESASRCGVRVLLSGNDGDSVVYTGVGYLAELARAGRWKTLHDETYALSRKIGGGRRDLIQRYVLGAFIPGSLVRGWKRLRGDGKLVYDTRSVIQPDFARRTGVEDRTRELLRDNRPPRTAREGHWHSLNSSLLTLVVETLAKGCAAFSLEPRYPFFDRRLMEFCLALPADQKLSNGWDRVVMRRAMDGILPPEIQWRSGKQNLSANFNLRLLQDEEQLLREIIMNGPEVIDEYVNVTALRDKYQRYASDPVRRSRDGFAVFWAVTIALWLRESALTP